MLKDFGTIGFCFLLPLFAFLLLGQLQTGPAFFDGGKNSGDPAYVSVLVQSHECEVPALRSRLGQQLQLNARTLRSGCQQRLQRMTDSSGFLPPEVCLPLFRIQPDKIQFVYNGSSYEVYSIFTSPVRAGPFPVLA